MIPSRQLLVAGGGLTTKTGATAQELPESRSPQDRACTGGWPRHLEKRGRGLARALWILKVMG